MTLKTLAWIPLFAALFLASGCVSRTITDEKPRVGKNSHVGSRPREAKVLEKKRVWIWEDDYKMP